MDQDVADRLSELSIFPTLKFAWDKPEIEDQVRQGIEYLRNAGIDLRHDVQFYVLTNYNTTHEEDLYRCRKLKEWGRTPLLCFMKGETLFPENWLGGPTESGCSGVATSRNMIDCRKQRDWR